MARTYITRANYFRHKGLPIPHDLKDVADKLNYDYCNSLRHGNNRQMYAVVKVKERRIRRAKEKNEVIEF